MGLCLKAIACKIRGMNEPVENSFLARKVVDIYRA
jgi:hypothetical protein